MSKLWLTKNFIKDSAFTRATELRDYTVIIIKYGLNGFNLIISKGLKLNLHLKYVYISYFLINFILVYTLLPNYKYYIIFMINKIMFINEINVH